MSKKTIPFHTKTQSAIKSSEPAAARTNLFGFPIVIYRFGELEKNKTSSIDIQSKLFKYKTVSDSTSYAYMQKILITIKN